MRSGDAAAQHVLDLRERARRLGGAGEGAEQLAHQIAAAIVEARDLTCLAHDGARLDGIAALELGGDGSDHIGRAARYPTPRTVACAPSLRRRALTTASIGKLSLGIHPDEQPRWG
jgi:hypothetical protein